MGKGDRRGKGGALPTLKPVPRKYANGKAKRPPPSQRHAKTAPDKEALNARCRKFGIAATPDARKAMSAPYCGSSLGMVIQRMSDSAEEALALWGVWQGLCAAEQTYSKRILGTTGNPTGSAFTLLQEKLQTDDHHSVDLRTVDEKDDDAVRRWMRWRGYLGALAAVDMSALLAAYREDGRELWTDRAPTAVGVATLDALKRLNVQIERMDRVRKRLG